MSDNYMNVNESGLRRDAGNAAELKDVLRAVYDALEEKGYNPINQIVGYILSEDPTYITNYKGARSIIRKVDRDELLAGMLRDYLEL